MGRFCAHNGGSVKDLLTTAGKIHPNVLKAVLVAAGVKHSVGVYAYHITLAASVRAGAAVSVIIHLGEKSFLVYVIPFSSRVTRSSEKSVEAFSLTRYAESFFVPHIGAVFV